MRQKRNPAKPSQYESLLSVIGHAQKTRGGFLVGIDKLAKPFRGTLTSEITESARLANKAEEAFEVILKRNPGIVKKDPDSPKTHSLLLVSLFAEVMNYRAKNALLLSLLFNAIVSLAKSQPEKSGKRAADITKTLRLEVASQVLRTGMLSKALDKFLAEQFEKSGSKVLPYVG